MNNSALEFVKKNYGCDINSGYYNKIDEWIHWWRGYHEPFHKIKLYNGKKHFCRDLYTLKMAKKVCEDWASVLLNEKTIINISDEKEAEFVLGTDGSSGVFDCNDFLLRGNRLIERAFATGTGAVTIRLKDAHINDKKQLIGGKDTEIVLDYMTAEYIIPISCSRGRITEAAFCSEYMIKGINHMFIEVHTLEKEGYVIHNHWFKVNNGICTPAELPEGIAEIIETRSDVPWFAIFTPNIENNIENNNGMGISILHGCLDVLKGIDIAYNNFNSDFELGAKKVFMLKDMYATLEDGTEVAPDDVGQQLFMMVDRDSMEQGGEKKFIYEFNPNLRVADNTNGIQAQLDYLSFKCGFGNKHYQFNSGTVVTAKQYVGEKQDFIQNAHKHYITVEAFLRSLVRSIIHIGHTYCGLGAENCSGTKPNSGDCICTSDIKVKFDKSVIIDPESEREQDRQDMRDGIMSKWEYRAKWYKESEDTAKKNIAEISGEADIYNDGGDFE